MSDTTKIGKTAQLESATTDRLLQLLCIIAQSLRRIELRLDHIAGVTPERQPNKIISFNTGG
jgi:hypothetical protein